MRGADRYRPLSLCVGLIVLALASCSLPAPPMSVPARLVVATNVYALEWILDQVGGDALRGSGQSRDLVEVRRLESIAHDADAIPPVDLETLATADMVFYIGDISPAVEERIGLDPYKNVDVRMLGRLNLLPADPELGDDALTDGKDPHVWLDPMRAQAVVDAAQVALVLAAERDQAFSEAVPDYDDVFFTSARATQDRLRQVREGMFLRLQACVQRTIVAEHPAFLYLASAFDMKQLAINKTGGGALSGPARQAQARRLDETWTAENGLRTIFIDPTRSGPTPGEERQFTYQLANELGAQVRYVESLETPPQRPSDEGAGYDAMMLRTAEIVAEGIGCDSVL